eukprot:gene11273-23586_t
MNNSLKEGSILERIILDEKKKIASAMGFKRISDFEESEQLKEALAESSLEAEMTETLRNGWKQNKIKNISVVFENSNELDNAKNMFQNVAIIDDDLPSFLGNSSKSNMINETSVSDTEIINAGSFWWKLPVDIAERVLEILCDVDMLGYLNCIAKRLTLRPTETTYKFLCKYIYLQQSIKKVLNVSNWGSWKHMLIYRPRVRTNGLYSLRTSYWKPPNNDAFWEEKKREFIEVKIYRHMRFFNNGTMLYSLDHLSPSETSRLFAEGLPIHKKVFLGTYEVSKQNISVKVRTHYAIIYFKLLITDPDDRYYGKFNRLRMFEHRSSALETEQYRNSNSSSSGNVESDIVYVNYHVPDYADLEFYRHWDWI